MFYPQAFDYSKYNPCSESPPLERHSIDQKEEGRMFWNHYSRNLPSLSQGDNLCYFLSLWHSPHCCSLQSKVALSFFSDSVPGGCWNTLSPPLYWFHPLVNYLCWIFFLLFFSPQTPADKTYRQQYASLTYRVPCSQQGNPGVHSSNTLLIKRSMEKAVCEPQAEGEKSLTSQRAQPLCYFLFFKVGKRA